MSQPLSHGDCHVHMILDAVYFRHAIDQHKSGPLDSVIRSVLEEYRQAGVTYLRDGGDNQGVCLRASQLAPEYGITYRMPVYAMHRAGRYGQIVGFPYSDLREFGQMMQHAKDRGADFIKVMVSGILDFNEVGKLSCPSLDAQEIRELVDRVHDAGMAVMFHINGRDAILAAIEAGADSLEHGFYMDEECWQALGEHPHTAWVPSIAPVANQIQGGRFPDDVLETITQMQMESVRQVWKAGGRICLGSDAGAYQVPHVQGIRDERRYLVDALAGVQSEAETDAMLADNEAWIRDRFFPQ